MYVIVKTMYYATALSNVAKRFRIFATQKGFRY